MPRVNVYSMPMSKYLHRRLRDNLRYIANPEKTHTVVRDIDIYRDRLSDCKTEPLKTYDYEPDKKSYDISDNVLVTGINCSQDPRAAADQFEYVLRTFNTFHKKPVMVAAVSVICDFEDENIDAYTAHDIGIHIVKEVFGDRCMALIATHCNVYHVHDHIMICRYSLDGRIVSRGDFPKMTEFFLSDIAKRTVSVYGFRQKASSRKGDYRLLPMYMWRSLQTNNYPDTKSGFLMRDIDYCIKLSHDLYEFLENMKGLGYIVSIKDGKIKMRTEKMKEGKEFELLNHPPIVKRHSLLGRGYTVEEICQRISDEKKNTSDTLFRMNVPLNGTGRFLYFPLSAEVNTFYAAHSSEDPENIIIGDDSDMRDFYLAFISLTSSDSDENGNIRWTAPPMRKHTSADKRKKYINLKGLFEGENGIKTAGEFKRKVLLWGRLSEKMRKIRQAVRPRIWHGYIYENQKKAADVYNDIGRRISKKLTGLLVTLRYIADNMNLIAGDMIRSFEMCRRLEDLFPEKLFMKMETEYRKKHPCHTHLKKRLEDMKERKTDRELIKTRGKLISEDIPKKEISLSSVRESVREYEEEKKNKRISEEKGGRGIILK